MYSSIFCCGFSPKKVFVLPCSSQNSAPTRKGGGRIGEGGVGHCLKFFFLMRYQNTISSKKVHTKNMNFKVVDTK